MKKVVNVFTDFVKYASEGETPSWIGTGTFHEEAYHLNFSNYDGSGSGKYGFFGGGVTGGNYPYMIPHENDLLSPEDMKLLSKPLQCFRNTALSHQPDRTEMVKNRNNLMMNWINWAKRNLHRKAAKCQPKNPAIPLLIDLQ